MAERGDQAKPPAGFLNPQIARRPAGRIGQRRQGPEGRQVLTHGAQRDELRLAHEIFAKRHGLDQRHVHAARVGKGDDVRQFGAIVLLQRDDVELDADASGLSRLDAAEHLRQVATAGDTAIDVGL